MTVQIGAEPATSEVDALPPFRRGGVEFLRRHGADLSSASVLTQFNTAWGALLDAMSATLRPFGITPAGYWLLLTLWTAGPCELRQLARLSATRKPAIVNAANTLERAGLVRRVRSLADRRLVTIGLSETGRALIEEAYPLQQQSGERLLAVLTVEERQMLARLLHRLAATRGHSPSSEP